MIHPIQEYFGQIVLLVFVIGILCSIAGMRAEPVIGGLFDVVRAVVIGIVKLVIGFFAMVVDVVALILKRGSSRR